MKPYTHPATTKHNSHFERDFRKRRGPHGLYRRPETRAAVRRLEKRDARRAGKKSCSCE